MGTRDPRVDAYIADAAEFAQPILRHLREVVHKHCPDVEEAIKWGVAGQQLLARRILERRDAAELAHPFGVLRVGDELRAFPEAEAAMLLER
ncbi:MAG TPA: hypothetical protein VM847_09860, partial [Tahibacter sp.]|nr:hypothetical protein [Tahibacter sp.]